MTSKTIEGYELPVSALAAALVCAGEDDVRYYLNGVYMDLPLGRIVSTDGHRMFCGAIPAADCAPVILPRALCEAALGAWRKLRKRDRAACRAFVLKLEGEPSQRKATLYVASAGASFMEAEIDGTFPQYARVVPPEKTSGEPGQFNTRYIDDAARALKLFARNDGPYEGCCVIEHNGPDSACRVTGYGAEAFVLVMPLRAGEPESCAWFNRKPATVSA